MDVRCEQCGTIYEFEDDRVSVTGITVKCTSCGHIFKVFAKKPEPAAAEPEPVAPPHDPGETPDSSATPAAKGTGKRWLIRKPSGEIFKFKELTTLQQWIVEQKVSREDEISRTGKVWERLGAIKELNPFFEVVDKARAADQIGESSTLMATGDEVGAVPVLDHGDDLAKPAPAPPPRTPKGPTPPPIAPRPPDKADLLEPDEPIEPDRADPLEPNEPEGAPEELLVETSEPYTMGSDLPDEAAEPDFANADLSAEEPSDHRAAWEDRSGGEREDLADAMELADPELDTPRRGNAMRLILVVVLGIAAGFGGFLVWSNWDRVKSLFSGERNPTQGAYYKGRTLFRMDTEASFQRALAHFDRLYRATSKGVAKGERANARAAQAEIYAAWAQYQRDDAVDLERQAEQKATSNPGVGDTAAAALRKQATALRQEAKDKAVKALNYARHAHGMVANLKTLRALAEAERVAGQPAAAVQRRIGQARALGKDDPELHYTFAMLAYDKGDLALAQKRLRRTVVLSNQRTGKPFFRAQMRLARVYASRGQRDSAVAVLRSITSRNPGHARAQRLLDRTKAAATAVAVRPPTADAGVPAAGMTPDAGAGPARPARPGTAPADVSGNYDTLVRRAERYSYGGNQAKAMVLYKKALEKRPGGVEALTGLGYAYLDQRSMSQAIRFFRRALGASGSYGEALIGLAEAYQRAGNAKQALKYYKRYLKHHPAGRRSVLAKQNVRELEEKLGKTAPRTAPMAMEPPPMAMEPPPMDRPTPMVREPPPSMTPVRPPPMDRPAPMVMDRPAPMVREPPPRGM